MENKQTINYQKQLDQIISKLTDRPKLALHSCCGPCSSYVMEYLSKYFDITLFYYNPNIYPEQEYQHRLAEQLRLCEIFGIPTVPCDYDPERYEAYIHGLEQEPEGGARCTKCFELRLDYTAAKAKELDFSLMTTTLTISPHKNAPLINTIGEAIAKKHGIAWLPGDFKKKRAINVPLSCAKSTMSTARITADVSIQSGTNNYPRISRSIHVMMTSTI